MFDCGKTCGVLPEEKEREGGNSSWQAVTSLHVRVKYQIIEEIFFFSLPFSEYAIGKRHAFSRRSTSLAKQRLSNRHSIRY